MTITFVFTLAATSPVKHRIFVVSSGVSKSLITMHLLFISIVNVPLSSVVTLCSHFLFTDNIRELKHARF